MNYNPSPKSEFVKDAESVKRHHEIVEDGRFRRSLEVALLQMSRDICNNAPADNMGACAASHLRMLGAQDFIHILLNLGEAPEIAKRADSTNLPSNVAKMKGN